MNNRDEAMNIEPETILEILAVVASALAAAIGALWRHLLKTQKAHSSGIEKKLEECEKKHEKGTEQLIALSEQVGQLKGAGEIADQIGTMYRDMCERLQSVRVDHR